MVALSDVRALLRPLAGRVKGIVRRATLGSLDTGTKAQSIQAGTTKGDEDDGVELFEPYGFTSGPPAGSEGLVLRVGAERAGSVAICFGDRTVRLAGLEQGEVAVYDDQGASIVLRRSGNIEVTPGDGGVVQLGGETATLAVARDTDPVEVSTASLRILQTAMSGWTPALGDGGAALAAALAPFFALSSGDVVQGLGTITAGGLGSTST